MRTATRTFFQMIRNIDEPPSKLGFVSAVGRCEDPPGHTRATRTAPTATHRRWAPYQLTSGLVSAQSPGARHRSAEAVESANGRPNVIATRRVRVASMSASETAGSPSARWRLIGNGDGRRRAAAGPQSAGSRWPSTEEIKPLRLGGAGTFATHVAGGEPTLRRQRSGWRRPRPTHRSRRDGLHRRPHQRPAVSQPGRTPHRPTRRSTHPRPRHCRPARPPRPHHPPHPAPQWTTLAIDAGVAHDQIQHDGGWADARMVSYYTHGRDQALRATTHSVAAYVLSAA